MERDGEGYEEAAVLVISFGCDITHDQLDQLLKHCKPNASWEHVAVPVEGRARLLEAIEQTIKEISDTNGRVIPQTVAEDFINGMNL